MNENAILVPLKIDLQISTDAYDDRLSLVVESARRFIETEGIELTDSIEDDQLVIMYAAYLFRDRRENKPMPRALRYALNNRLLSQKAGAY